MCAARNVLVFHSEKKLAAEKKKSYDEKKYKFWRNVGCYVFMCVVQLTRFRLQKTQQHHDMSELATVFNICIRCSLGSQFLVITMRQCVSLNISIVKWSRAICRVQIEQEHEQEHESSRNSKKSTDETGTFVQETERQSEMKLKYESFEKAKKKWNGTSISENMKVLSLKSVRRYWTKKITE